MECYLDNAATTKPYPEVIEKMQETLQVAYGNPSSMHRKGFEAEQYVKEAAEILAKEWKTALKEIVFTSGGTESNNLALIGCALANQRSGKHIITTQFEHPSVHNPLIFLEELGFQISYIQVDQRGKIDFEQLEREITSQTIMVSIMYVNNETGARQDIAAISKMIKSKKPDILFHVDAIQAFGKYTILPKRDGIDLMSVSGHKVHGPKGSGALFISDKVKIKPVLYGGGQQNDRRSGTENVPAIAGFGKAVELTYRNLQNSVERMTQRKEWFVKELMKLDQVIVNAVDPLNIRDSAPHIVSASFLGIRSEVLLHSLEDKNIYVSSGSACASNHPSLSGSLKAIGLSDEQAESTLRFSFTAETTQEELEYTIETLRTLLPVLRKFRRQ